MAELEPRQPSAPLLTGRRITVGVLVFFADVGVSVGIGFAATGVFNWTVAALVLTALGTLILAAATGALAASTWQDVRHTQRLADAAAEANRVATEERERRSGPAAARAV